MQREAKGSCREETTLRERATDWNGLTRERDLERRGKQSQRDYRRNRACARLSLRHWERAKQKVRGSKRKTSRESDGLDSGGFAVPGLLMSAGTPVLRKQKPPGVQSNLYLLTLASLFAWNSTCPYIYCFRLGLRPLSLWGPCSCPDTLVMFFSITPAATALLRKLSCLDAEAAWLAPLSFGLCLFFLTGDVHPCTTHSQ